MRLHSVSIPVAALLATFAAAAAAQQRDSSAAPPAEARFVQLRHLRMYYERSGAGRPIVFLHGGASTIQASFAAQLPEFARDHLVIAPEQRGHGHTGDVPGPYRYADMADDTAELLDRLGIANADIVGWSDGGTIGLMLAVRRPDLVRRLVVSGANVLPGAQTITPEMQTVLREYRAASDTARQAEYARLSGDSLGGWAVAIAKLKRLWLEHPTPDEIGPRDLARIRAPTLVMAGDRDVIRLEHTLAIYRGIPGASLYIVPATEHATFRDRPAWVDPVVRGFLDEPVRR